VLAGVLSSASLMAQVYSLNAVGYINVVCPPGFSFIANQLNTTNNNISPLLDSQFSTGQFDNCVLWKYAPGTGAGSGWSSIEVESGSFLGIPYNTYAATNTTMNPGEGVFFNNVYTTNVTLTFVGTVITGSPITPSVSLAPGFNVVSSQVPVAGAVDSVLGLNSTNGLNINDVVWLYDTSLTPTPKSPSTFESDEYVGGFLTWSSGSAPVVAVGQAFFYFNSTGTTNSWTTSFSVN